MDVATIAYLCKMLRAYICWLHLCLLFNFINLKYYFPYQLLPLGPLSPFSKSRTGDFTTSNESEIVDKNY